jgi:hypothetical protein
MSPPSSPDAFSLQARWPRFTAAVVRNFHVYANWLVGITWRRFIVLSVLLMILAVTLQNLPPFTWKLSETVTEIRTPKPPKPPKAAKAPREPIVKIEKGAAGSEDHGVDISIDEHGVRIRPRSAPAAASAASAASAAEPGASAPAASASESERGIEIHVPPGADSREVKQAMAEARRAIKEAMKEARDSAREAARDAEQAARDAAEAAEEATAAVNDAGETTIVVDDTGTPKKRVRVIHLGDALPDLAWLWIIGSVIIKITYKGRMQAEVKAAQATEMAEAELLKRQVSEARMAAMQAQIEPHFLFNTLASIDHLIETDPARASAMQKNLIALLRASMPTMRETNSNGAADLARELAMVRPYLEILKVRMEERLQTEVDVPEGLLSAKFPPMMIQTLVENAIKHGLEPKPEGGSLKVKAEIAHGKLVVSVSDTGLGFGKAATAGTGVGLDNIRERLQLLYGNRARLSITENRPSGTVATIEVPYETRNQEGAA